MIRLLRAVLNLLFRSGVNAGYHPAMENDTESSQGNWVLTGGLGERDEHVLIDEDGADVTLYAEDKNIWRLPSGRVVRLTRREMRTCDFGHVLGHGNNVAGRCAVCSSIICAKCCETCSFCGASVCRSDSFNIGGKTYCTHHRIIGLSRAFLGV
jgi:hypothetical protein